MFKYLLQVSHPLVLVMATSASANLTATGLLGRRHPEVGSAPRRVSSSLSRHTFYEWESITSNCCPTYVPSIQFNFFSL
ncbi:hypothetical protein DFH06DRAFT_1236626 [Mycena polygramma]|nr:hypothetical protein DFH06DRAFT_1238302 [Mycena polygramma]KAJ7618855.1 hypothetical protein DFH06DRAFT_1236626 [Mycena polygramma]